MTKDIYQRSAWDKVLGRRDYNKRQDIKEGEKLTYGLIHKKDIEVQGLKNYISENEEVATEQLKLGITDEITPLLNNLAESRDDIKRKQKERAVLYSLASELRRNGEKIQSKQDYNQLGEILDRLNSGEVPEEELDRITDVLSDMKNKSAEHYFVADSVKAQGQSSYRLSAGGKAYLDELQKRMDSKNEAGLSIEQGLEERLKQERAKAG